MLGRTSAEAVNNYRQHIQSLVSCVTNSVADVAGGYRPGPYPHSLLLNNGRPVRLGGTSRLGLQLQQSYLIDTPTSRNDRWLVRVIAYAYTLFDVEQREVLSYHWHPMGNSPIVTPHLHLEQGAQVGRPEVRDAHLPTGAISVGTLLRFLIQDLLVTPERQDWEPILAEDQPSP